MRSRNPEYEGSWQIEPILADPEGQQLCEDPEEWDMAGPSPRWEDVRDAFESRDEMAEPQPEYGDFWGQPDTEEEVWT
jgi:hypothetical protein